MFLNGRERGTTPLELVVHVDDIIEVRKDGYQTLSLMVNPDEIRNQTIEFEMVTPMEFAMRQAPPQYISSTNLVMVEFPPINYQGRFHSPNNTDPVTGNVSVSRPFYLSKYEISYRDYAKFNPKGNPKNLPQDTPVVEITWLDAVRYCNWLSAQEGYAPVYQLNSRGLVDKVNNKSLGYRLPTEVEWEAALAYDVKNGRLNQPYPWGSSDDVPRAFANLAGRELWRGDTRYLQNHVDNSIEVASTGSYPSNINGLHGHGGKTSPNGYMTFTVHGIRH